MQYEKFASVPRLVEGKREWYVYFQAYHPLKNKLAPVKIIRGFKNKKTPEEKRAWGKLLCKEYEKKLRTGWNPWEKKETVIYTDEVVYHNKARVVGRRKRSIKNMRYYISDYLSHRKVSLKKKTFESYQSKVRMLCIWLEKNNYGDYDVSAINNTIILKFFEYLCNERELDRPTVEKYVLNLRDFFNYLKRNKKILVNPIHDIPIPKKKVDNAARPIPLYDLKRLLAHIQEQDKQLFLACMFQYYCFIRPGNELRSMRIRDIDFFTGQIRIGEVDAKNGTTEIVDMPDQLLALCNDVYQLSMFNPDFYVFGNCHVPGPKQYGQNTLRNRFNKYRDDLGLPNVYKFYSLKHSGAGILLESGATIVELMDQLRHRELNTTHHYIKRHFGNRSKHIKKNFPSPL